MMRHVVPTSFLMANSMLAIHFVLYDYAICLID